MKYNYQYQLVMFVLKGILTICAIPIPKHIQHIPIQQVPININIIINNITSISTSVTKESPFLSPSPFFFPNMLKGNLNFFFTPITFRRLVTDFCFIITLCKRAKRILQQRYNALKVPHSRQIILVFCVFYKCLD